MAKLNALVPAISITCPPAELIATEAGRSERGLVATVQAYNGELRHVRLVKLALPQDCLAFATETAKATGAKQEHVEQKLLELTAAIENRLRERPGNRTQRTTGPLNAEASVEAAQETFGEYLAWRSPDETYAIVNARTFQIRFDSKGEETLLRVANFAARVKEETALDDGVEVTRYYTIEGKLFTGKPLPSGRVLVAKFAGMSWPAEIWGLGPSLVAGMGAKDHLRAAIECFSGTDVPRITVFVHLGWRKIPTTGWAFLHAGGAVGGGNIAVDLEAELQRYCLPADRGDVVESMRLSLKILDLGDPRITFTLWAIVWRAPLCEWLPFLLVLWLLGETGTLKSTVAALILSHFGGPFDKDSLPASWLDTENRLEQKAFLAKDVPLVVDDFCPEKHAGFAQELERRASRIIRAAGNRQARGRLRSDLSARRSYFPRGIVVATAEQLPNSAVSALARIFPVPFEKGAIEKEKLSELQAKAYLLPDALRAYLDHLALQGDGLRDALRERFEDLRKKARVDGHDRLPESVAHLYLGFEMGIAFAVQINAIEEGPAQELLRKAWKVFMDLAHEHATLLQDERPVPVFIQALQEGLASGRAWLADRTTGDLAAGTMSPGTEKLGWVDPEGIYLLPSTAYAFVSERLRHRNGMNLGERALRGMLLKDGLLLRESEDRLLSKPRCEGKPTWILWLRPDALGELPSAKPRHATCHSCGKPLAGNTDKKCSDCGWLVCPNCGACDPKCGGVR